MRRPLATVSLLAVALLLSACAASQAPGWTFAPPTPAPTPGPSQSAAASTAPSAEASAAASGEAPSAGASAAASGGTVGAAVVDITASGVQWTTKDVTAPANAAFKIHFDNQDASTQHNIIIKDGTGMEMFKTDLLTGAATMDYDVPALAAGTYTFVCLVHPSMVGNLVVGP